MFAVKPAYTIAARKVMIAFSFQKHALGAVMNFGSRDQ